MGRKGHRTATTTMCQSGRAIHMVRNKADVLRRENHCFGPFLHATRSLLLPCVGEEDGGWRRKSVREEDGGGVTCLCLRHAEQATATRPTTLTLSHDHRTPAGKASRRRTGSLRHPTRPCQGPMHHPPTASVMNRSLEPRTHGPLFYHRGGRREWRVSKLKYKYTMLVLNGPIPIIQTHSFL